MKTPIGQMYNHHSPTAAASIWGDVSRRLSFCIFFLWPSDGKISLKDLSRSLSSTNVVSLPS